MVSLPNLIDARIKFLRAKAEDLVGYFEKYC
jgi:hypothetical protein